MEIVPAILLMVLEPAISIFFFLKQIWKLWRSIDTHQDGLRSLSCDVSLLKNNVTQLLDRLNCSTEQLQESLVEPLKVWLERWIYVIEEAESIIAECNGEDQASCCSLPRFNNTRKIKQAKQKIKEMSDMTPTLCNIWLLHILLLNSQRGFQKALNGSPPSRTQMAVTSSMSNDLRRLQDTASSVTISPWFNVYPLRLEIQNFNNPDFALAMRSYNPPNSAIVNWNEHEGNPSAPAQEMIVECCEEKLLITTNVERVQEIGALSEQDRWEMFQFLVFKDIQNHRDFIMYRKEMEEISRAIFQAIVAKPCLIEAVAHMLSKFDNPFYWYLKLALFSSPPDHLDDRYDALPLFIKPFFLSCAAFPQGEEIDVENLLDLWIAGGLLSIKHDLIDQVSFGYQVIKLLLRYSLIEVCVYDWSGRPERCTLPDEIHGMAVRILHQNESCFFRLRQNLQFFSWPKSPLCRNISLICNNITSLPAISGSESVRSLLLTGNTRLAKVPRRFLQGLILLRILDLSDTGVVSLPSSLGDLKNLIHLNLSRTRVIILPKACVRCLKKLQSLLLSCCTGLKSLPPEIRKLQSLKHLDVSGCTSLAYLPHTIREVRELQVLETNGTHVWHSTAGFLKWIAKLFCTVQRRYAILSDLKTLINLKRLHLHSEEDSLISNGVMRNMHKMQNLWLRMTKLGRLPEDMTAMTELCELQLWNCMKLEELPSWVCEFLELRFLCLSGCHSLRSLPCLERLPLLWVLEIAYCEALMEFPSEFGREAGFPALKWFTVRGLNIRSFAICRGAMPKLMRMTLQECKKMESLPEEIQHMENLQALDITGSELLIHSVASRPNLWPLNSCVQVIPPVL